MKYEFAVAHSYHSSGASPKYIDNKRFLDYDSAKDYASSFLDECFPTIYIIFDNTYVFYCKRSAVENNIVWLYSIRNTEWGQIETRIWWKDFLKNPQSFYHLAIDKI